MRSQDELRLLQLKALDVLSSILVDLEPFQPSCPDWSTASKTHAPGPGSLDARKDERYG